jgi:glycine/D-amino acid oxidase-like deaminating enzyme
MAASTKEQEYRRLSLWWDGLPGAIEPRKPLEGSTSADVAIVGAGFTGLWCAYYLKRQQRHLRVVIIEREVAGFGPAGRNAGWASGGIAGNWRVYERSHGKEAVRRAELLTYSAVDEIGEVVRRERIDCGYAKNGMVIVAMTPAQEARLVADVERARERKLTAAGLCELTSTELEKLIIVPSSRRAIYSPHNASIDPARLVRGLAGACERAGVVIYEGTKAVAINRGYVDCVAGRVQADHILLATESYTTQLPRERRRYLPLYHVMLATEPLPADVWDAIGWHTAVTFRDRRHLFFHAKRTRDDRLAVGGRGAPYKLSQPLAQPVHQDRDMRAKLQNAVGQYFPAAARFKITHQWGGPLAVPRDWCMAITYDQTTGLGSAGGYSGHGLVAANIAGRTLADLVLARDTELGSLPWVGHISRKWEPEPIRFLASRAVVGVLGSADRYEDTHDGRARRAALVAAIAQPS